MPNAAVPATLNVNGMKVSLRPKLRPRKFRRIARAQERLRQKGAVCGDLDIQGDIAGRVTGERTGCGIQNAVRVRSVSGITLSQPAVLDCTTAQALKSWVDTTAKPALSRKGGGLKQLRVAAHYSCRTRNNRAGARLSEHSKGRAIDISAVRLQDGSLITVRNGWNGKDTAQAMRLLHKGACGPFGTVLGPNSDRFHVDHFHFDTARYRSGPYCR
ncbi:MAG: extensin family protein [Roseobacter sp.]